MSRRAKIIIGIMLVLAVLFVIFLALWYSKRTSVSGNIPSAQAPQLGDTLGSRGKANGQTTPTPPQMTQRSDQRPAALSLETAARSYIERYGTYSNQSDFENIEDLYEFMTDRLQNREQEYVENARAENTSRSGGYFGITTRIVSLSVLDRTDTRASIRASTQRYEVGGDLAAPRTYYQDIELELLKSGESWKVDRAEWK